MGLLDTEPGKRRLLAVEIPAIERYNAGRDPEFRISVTRVGGGLVLSYCLKPCHNIYRMETRLLSSYPIVPPETRVLTPLKHCPHLLEGQTMCLWRQGSTRASSRWDASQFSCVFAIVAAWRWLLCYEIWHETGEWPLPEAKLGRLCRPLRVKPAQPALLTCIYSKLAPEAAGWQSSISLPATRA